MTRVPSRIYFFFSSDKTSPGRYIPPSLIYNDNESSMVSRAIFTVHIPSGKYIDIYIEVSRIIFRSPIAYSEGPARGKPSTEQWIGLGAIVASLICSGAHADYARKSSLYHPFFFFFIHTAPVTVFLTFFFIYIPLIPVSTSVRKKEKKNCMLHNAYYKKSFVLLVVISPSEKYFQRWLCCNYRCSSVIVSAPKDTRSSHEIARE